MLDYQLKEEGRVEEHEEKGRMALASGYKIREDEGQQERSSHLLRLKLLTGSRLREQEDK